MQGLMGVGMLLLPNWLSLSHHLLAHSPALRHWNLSLAQAADTTRQKAVQCAGITSPSPPCLYQAAGPASPIAAGLAGVLHPPGHAALGHPAGLFLPGMGQVDQDL